MDKITRRDFLKLLGGVTITALAGCAQDRQSDLANIDEQISSLGFKNSMNSYFDDVLVCHPGVEVVTVRAALPFNMSLIDASNMMEKSISVNELFKKYGFGKLDGPISDHDDQFQDFYFSKGFLQGTELTLEENELINMGIDDIELLFEDLEGESLTEIEKDEVKRKLFFIRAYYDFWHGHNNANICGELLSSLLKSYAVQIVGLTPEQFSLVEVTSKGEVSVSIDGYEHKYIIDGTSGTLNQCLVELLNCQTSKDLYITANGDESEINKYNNLINEAIVALKNGMLCGVRLENGTLRQEVEVTDELVEETVPKTL